MIEPKETNVDLLITGNSQNRSLFQKIDCSFRQVVWYVLICMVYAGASYLFSEFLVKRSSTNAFVVFVTYIALLLIIVVITHVIRWRFSKRNKEGEYPFTEEEIASSFLLNLIATTCYLLVLYFISKDEMNLTMAIVCGTLYLGFAVPLDKLCGKTPFKDILLYTIKPFRLLGMTPFKWYYIILFLLPIVLIAFMAEYPLALVCFAVLTFVLIFIEKHKLTKFCEDVSPQIEGKSVLLWQVDKGDPITIALKNWFKDENIAVSQKTENTIGDSQYDIVIIVISAKKCMDQIELINQIMSMTKKDSNIIDLDVCTKKGNGQNHSRLTMLGYVIEAMNVKE